MRLPKVERFARELEPEVSLAVRYASATKTSARRLALDGAFVDPEEARRQAADVKAYVLDNLKALLLQFEEQATARGVKVHWAADADAARRIVLELCKGAGHGAIIAKGKSMATEEIHLNAALEEAGYKPVETDLGEYVVQLDHDAPSHIVTPIIHKSRLDIARSFHREGLGPYTEEPGELTMQARAHLRSMFRQAEVGISGVNFAIAETGRIVIVENEGNNRFSTTAPRIHIALMGIEKLLPSEAHLGLFLRLLVGSATGQRAPVYTHLIDGPRRSDEPDGPDEVHVVLLDNGRSRILQGPYRDILRCIRCGACLNVCPVYREVSGHAYRHVYPGPLGAVLAPALDGVAEMGDLAKASTLCGACEEVCPVKIPIPDLLLRLRAEAAGTGQDDAAPWGLYGAIARDPTRWRAGLKLLPMALKIPNPHVSRWTQFREVPEQVGRSFRRWWHERR